MDIWPSRRQRAVAVAAQPQAMARRRLVAAVGALLLAATCVAGCGRRWAEYRGRPVAFSTHSYRVLRPPMFLAIDPQQTSAERVTVASFHEDVFAVARSLQSATVPAFMHVTCLRMRKGETAQTFIERRHDEVAAYYMEVRLRPVRKPRSGHSEYTLACSDPDYLAARVIVLPRERIAYQITTTCPAGKRAAFDEQLRRVRDSFELERARG